MGAVACHSLLQFRFRAANPLPHVISQKHLTYMQKSYLQLNPLLTPDIQMPPQYVHMDF